MNLDHQHVQNLLQSGRRLTPEEQAALDQHLAACADCRAYAAFDRQLSQMLPAAYPPVRHSEREIRQKFDAVQSRFEKSHWTQRIFQHTLSLAGAGAALLLLVVVFSLLPHLLNQQPALIPAAPTRDRTGSPTRTPTPAIQRTPTVKVVQMGQASPTPTPMADGFQRVYSPDHQWTALYQKGQLFIESAGGMRIRVGSADAWITPGAWSPDSRAFTYWQGSSSTSIQADGLPLWAVDAVTGKTAQIAKTSLLNTAYQSWAPDGSALVFTNGGGRSAQLGKWLSLYKSGNSQVTDLVTQDKLVPGQVAWSPDGDTIAFAAVDASLTGAKSADSMAWDNPAIAGRRIYLLNPATGAYKRLNAAESYQDAPRWGMDGRLYYVQIDAGLANIMVVDAAGGIPAARAGKALTGCQGKPSASAGYYGQVDWTFLFSGCGDLVQTAEMQGIGAVKSVARIQNSAFVGSGARLIAVDLSDPTAPRLDAKSVDLPGEVVKALTIPAANGQAARVAASAGRYLAVFAPTPGDLSLITQSKLPGPVAGLVLDINTSRLYAAGPLNSDASKGYIVILDASPRDRLDLLATLQLPAPVTALALGKSALYAATAGPQPGVMAVPLSKNAFGAPQTVLQTLPVYSMTVAGDGLYLGCDRYLMAYAISDPLKPQPTWTIDPLTSGAWLPGPVLGFELRADAIYMAGLDAAGRIFTVDFPPPAPLKSSSMVDTASFTSVAYGQLLVAGDRLEIYLVTKSRTLSLLGAYPRP